jgi:cell wall-associated NlpC family hydrolase
MTIRQKIATIALSGAVLSGGLLTVAGGSASAAPVTSRAVAATSDQISTAAAAALASMGTDQFGLRLSETSSVVAARLGVDAAGVLTAWARADQVHQIALLSALTQVGVPYHRNTSKVGVGFDCSGLTTFAWGQAGIELARHSTTQLRNAAPRTPETAQAGDLVYFPGHVMMWLGLDNLIVHAPSRGHPVEVKDLSSRSAKRLKFGNPNA